LVDLFEYLMMHGLTNPKFKYETQNSSCLPFFETRRCACCTPSISWTQAYV